MGRLLPRLGEEKGSALIMAIIAMLVLGVFVLSFTVLADLEVRLGINQKEAQQALVLAEAGMEHGKNMLRAAAGLGSFNSAIATSTTRRLGIPNGGIAVGTGKYWARVDNDCTGTGDNGELAGGNALTPPLVPAAAEDNSLAPCSTTVDQNQTVVLTAWAETGNGRGRARIRAHYTMVNPWTHSCYDGDGGLCINPPGAVGGCNQNPCVDPSDPSKPNGPEEGPMPVPNDIRCGTAGSGSFPPIPAGHIPPDVLPSMTASAPCVMYPYYQIALFTAGPTREKCLRVTGGGYGANQCNPVPGTFAYTTDPANPNYATCSNAATSSKCHGLVFFGPGNTAATLATGADIQIGAGGTPDIRCVGTQNDTGSRPCHDGGQPNSSLVVYGMGKVTITNNVEVQGTVVLHGNGVAGTNSFQRDFGLTGTNRITTRPCTGGAGTCGYPLALLAYNPNEPPPITAGQTIHLDLSNATSFISGIIYTSGTADFSPLTTDGGVIAWDVHLSNTATSINYNATYGAAAPPPGFGMPPGGDTVAWIPATWVHCTSYGTSAAVLSSGPTACQ